MTVGNPTENTGAERPAKAMGRGEGISDSRGFDWRDPWRLGKRIKHILPRSLLGRALLIMVMPLILVQIITAWVFYDRHFDYITDNLARALASEIAVVTEHLLREEDPAKRQEIFNLHGNLLWMKLSFKQHETLPPDHATRKGYMVRKLRRALNRRVSFNVSIDSEQAGQNVVVFVQMLDGVLRAEIHRERLFNSTSDLFVIWMVGSSILFFGVATMFMRNQVRPIRRLARAAERFGKGRDTPSFTPEGATEVRQAAAAFIQMRDRIRRQMRQRTEMLAGVSHDLRTPLTRMKLSLALIGDGPELKELRSDLVEMERMIEGYLAFARGEGSEAMRPTSLGDLLSEVVEQTQRELANQQGKTLDVHIEEQVSLPLRRNSMRRCLQNLVSNALRYGDNVSIRLGREGPHVVLVIDDDGPGIPEEMREDVFKPFFRLDTSRNPETGGTGLGLTIARDAVRSHGGDVRLEASPLGGLRVRLRVPV
ncbi:ATP-binding protein [Limibacillus halophilus]|uniref:histidine kinase n=1 Tax=Limibacillus halophilus TaxID=1579333 RepID=A0A839SZ27_9PROT|nr:ATP-binding protein [Limibacillus halophilus]MBB3066864.1 two-component system osmolarity sensor histidine kinase EnvZ [Limibacillus halophilus]